MRAPGVVMGAWLAVVGLGVVLGISRVTRYGRQVTLAGALLTLLGALVAPVFM